jgi:putative SOS response-associated peptidase YedK
MADEKPFAFAGIWSQQKVEGETVEVCAVLTTQPNDLVRAVHDRMPVILDPKDFDLWLNSEDVRDFEKIDQLFKPFPAGKMSSYAVGSVVNQVTHDGPECIKPSNEPETLSFQF